FFVRRFSARDAHLVARVQAAGEEAHHLRAQAGHPGMFRLVVGVVGVKSVQKDAPVFEVASNWRAEEGRVAAIWNSAARSAGW
ncbi:MAG: hypothetical protein AB6733_18545, partial [Clostridiaceae bacterium]